MTVVSVVTILSSEINHATSTKKIMQPKKKPFFLYFFSTFGMSNLTHLTTDVMYSGQRLVILVFQKTILIMTLIFSGKAEQKFKFCSIIWETASPI